MTEQRQKFLAPFSEETAPDSLRLLEQKVISLSLSLSWKRTAAIKLVEGNGSSSFYCDTSPPYAPSIYTYIYISARDAQVNASNQPEAIPPLTNDALSSNSIVTDVQRARY